MTCQCATLKFNLYQNAGISKLLSDTGKELNTKFDRISFRNVFDSIVNDVNQMARKCGELDQRAKQLCNDLHTDIEEFSNILLAIRTIYMIDYYDANAGIHLPPSIMTRSPSGIPVLGDIRVKTTIPLVH